MTDDKRLTKSLPVLLGECAKEVAESAAENKKLRAERDAALRLLAVAAEAQEQQNAKVQAVRHLPRHTHRPADGQWWIDAKDVLAAIGDGDKT